MPAHALEFNSAASAGDALEMKKTMIHPALNTMRAAARGVITSHISDLETHDVARLADLDPAIKFVWMCHSTGTHLVRGDADDATIETYRESFDPRSGGCRSDGQYWYVWNGSELTHGPHGEVFEALAADATGARS